jgi:hypothetical protein
MASLATNNAAKDNGCKTQLYKWHLSPLPQFVFAHDPFPTDVVANKRSSSRDLTVEQGYAAARLTGLNCLACIQDVVGDLDRVTGLVRSLNFIACDPSSRRLIS